ncbi:hypothetical protein BCR32DRAFT_299851 [Anaeromyces robustus]|uniref:Uncharacterized protein n=1 Tax=Anaeromyces robustus TaxID=1754192 RepID=A0A1Y1X4U5_9FUNG|nr:hypothetical protein BCR32DRAFT_299851 [Anaeromyces robustus]|eukprot:ORX80841.1 hypothetical protein BCR32DRAFT_299851 [Anaeromyces robustus]
MTMTVREIMLRKFKNYKYIIGEREIDPIISEKDCDEDSPFYLGRYENDKEQVYWKPIKMNGEIFNFEELEKKIGVKLWSSIKEYYQTYWFLDYIEHYIDKYGILHEVHMPAVEPGFEIKSLEYAIEDYQENTGDYSNDFIPFGYDYLTSMPIMIENSTGKVYLYEDGIEKGEFKFLCDSLEELLGQHYEEE